MNPLQSALVAVCRSPFAAAAAAAAVEAAAALDAAAVLTLLVKVHQLEVEAVLNTLKVLIAQGLNGLKLY